MIFGVFLVIAEIVDDPPVHIEIPYLVRAYRNLDILTSSGFKFVSGRVLPGSGFGKSRGCDAHAGWRDDDDLDMHCRFGYQVHGREFKQDVLAEYDIGLLAVKLDACGRYWWIVGCTGSAAICGGNDLDGCMF